MKVSLLLKVATFIGGLFLLLVPVIAAAEYQKAPQDSPPIEQPLVREGAFAQQLASALGLGNAGTEAEAESMLGEKGILPRNGWIADYPATPDIIGELRQSVSDAADAGKLSINRPEALKRFDGVTAEAALNIRPQDEDAIVSSGAEGEYAVAPTDLNNYYYDVGPPVVTYYTPPADFFYLYSWVPYPFWCNNFWFGGFFILNDFHRNAFDGHHHHQHHGKFVSNHFHGSNGFTRIDPVARFNGQSNVAAGVGVRAGSVPAGSQVNTRSNMTTTGTQAFTGGSRASAGRWSGSRPAGSSGTGYSFYRGDSQAVRSVTTNSRGNASSPAYSFPVSHGNSFSRGHVPATSYSTFRSNSPPVRSYSPPAGTNTPARSFGSSIGSTTSFHGSGMGGNAFHGSGGFHGGGMSGSSFHGSSGFHGSGMGGNSFHGGGGFSGGFGGRR